MTNKNKVTIDYKKKVSYHCKRKMNNLKLQDLLKHEKLATSFTTYEEVYKYVKELTISNKRKWIEDKIDCRLLVWDTDLEPHEQDCIDHLVEFFNYEKGTFEIDELQEIIAENLDEPICESCDCLIRTLEKRSKEIIEIE